MFCNIKWEVEPQVQLTYIAYFAWIFRLKFTFTWNILFQIRGKKELVLFEPHDNTKLYEAHIPEALLGFNSETKEFRRKILMDSTSMVMAPLDIQDPDFQVYLRDNLFSVFFSSYTAYSPLPPPTHSTSSSCISRVLKDVKKNTKKTPIPYKT